MRFGKSAVLLKGLIVYGLAVGQTYAAGKFWSVCRHCATGKCAYKFV